MGVPPDDLQPAPHLTAAEQRVLALLPTHLTMHAIADELFIARSTAKTHALAVYGKLKVHSRSAAVQRAIELGLLEQPQHRPAEPPTRAGRVRLSLPNPTAPLGQPDGVASAPVDAADPEIP